MRAIRSQSHKGLTHPRASVPVSGVAHVSCGSVRPVHLPQNKKVIVIRLTSARKRVIFRTMEAREPAVALLWPVSARRKGGESLLDRLTVYSVRSRKAGGA